MAYSATISVSQVGIDPQNRGYYEVTITETEVSSSDEATVDQLPPVGRILRQTCKLTSGSGSTIDPVLGIATGAGTVDITYENGTAASAVNNEPNAGEGTPYHSPNGTLFHKSNPDTGSDNAITTVYLIVAGW